MNFKACTGVDTKLPPKLEYKILCMVPDLTWIMITFIMIQMFSILLVSQLGIDLQTLYTTCVFYRSETNVQVFLHLDDTSHLCFYDKLEQEFSNFNSLRKYYNLQYLLFCIDILPCLHIFYRSAKLSNHFFLSPWNFSALQCWSVQHIKFVSCIQALNGKLN